MISNCSLKSICNSNLCNVNFENRKNALAFKSSDIFQKTIPEVYSKAELLKIMQGENKYVSKEFLDRLSDDDYEFCQNYAKGSEKIFGSMVQYSDKSVMKEDVEDIIKYSKVFYRGLNQIAQANGKNINDVILVSIGQSPTSIVKTMEFMGVKTVYCPISGLASFNEPVEKYVNDKTVDKILGVWEKFGFNINDLKSDKLVIFTDHKETGNTFMVFKDIIQTIKKMKKIDNKNDMFLKLKYIFYQGKPTKEDKEFEKDFYDSAFHTSYMKTLYSPLFKLPIGGFMDFDNVYENRINKDANGRFNKLSILLFDGLKNGKPDIEKRSFRNVDNERQYRLSFYTPE